MKGRHPTSTPASKYVGTYMYTPSLISTYIIQTPHYTHRHMGKGNRETTQEKEEGRRCLGELVQGVECLPHKHEDLPEFTCPDPLTGTATGKPRTIAGEGRQQESA